MNKKIEIPKGYIARIEGNSIILEPEESEDEKIRKELIKLLNIMSDGIVENYTTIPLKDFVAYLEKQKEHKQVDIDFVSDWLRKHIKTYVNSEYNEFHKTMEYDGSINIEHLIEDLKKEIEQQPFAHESDFVSKPTEWSEYDKATIEYIIEDIKKLRDEETDEEVIETYDRELNLLQCINDSVKLRNYINPAEWIEDEKIRKDIIAFIKFALKDGSAVSPGSSTTKEDAISWLEKQEEQKSSGWSEEDERLLNIIIDILDREEHNGHLMHDDLKACIKLLKSLRPQPKKEWSEGTKKMLNEISDYLKYKGREDDADFIRNLCPQQPQWKPSEEQIAHLIKMKDYVAQASGYWGGMLSGLIYDLQKLL